ncbi:MAG TPA: gamma-glutamylcyclotransferase [Jatrophihabitans sp.]|nr:gamma-glutamylcyclotransferase [Jatrophihabitans sp.]
MTIDGSVPESDYPAVPYPGARPPFSYAHVDGRIHRVTPQRLDEWLADRGEPRLHGRRHLLTYGSNACPSKIGWLRAELGLTGAVIVLRARCTGLAAVWAAGRRMVDDQRPATLTAAPGVVEQHAVWLATDEQLRVLDRCEGRGVRYRLVHVHTGTVELEDGTPVPDPLAYVGLAAIRRPLIVDGSAVRCADVTQAAAMTLRGIPAADDGLDVTDAPVPAAS